MWLCNGRYFTAAVETRQMWRWFDTPTRGFTRCWWCANILQRSRQIFHRMPADMSNGIELRQYLFGGHGTQLYMVITGLSWLTVVVFVCIWVTFTYITLCFTGFFVCWILEGGYYVHIKCLLHDLLPVSCYECLPLCLYRVTVCFILIFCLLSSQSVRHVLINVCDTLLHDSCLAVSNLCYADCLNVPIYVPCTF